MTQPKTTEKASAPAGVRAEDKAFDAGQRLAARAIAQKSDYWVSDEETGDHLVPEKFRPLAEANEELSARLKQVTEVNEGLGLELDARTTKLVLVTEQRNDLLEACKALFRECSMVHKHWGDGSNQEQSDAAIAAARAAIARAEGSAA